MGLRRMIVRLNKTLENYRQWRSTNHKLIGSIYFYLGAWAGTCGFGYSVLIRINNIRPGTSFLRPEVYVRVVTTHAILIIFFFVIPILIGGFGNWLVPMMLGSPDMFLPRVNAFRLWALFPSLRLLLYGGQVEGGMGTGWTIYPPLRSIGYHGRPRVDLGIIRLHLAGASSIIGSINFLVTLFQV